ncbi:MAG TPA: hypothetical protein VJJ28_01730 [Candidatus Paceibacterota bacterium]
MNNNKKRQNLALEKKEREVRPVVAGALVLSILVVLSASFFFKGSKEAPDAVVKTAEVVGSEKISATNVVANAVIFQNDGSVIIHDKGATAKFAPMSEKSPTPVMPESRRSQSSVK